MDAQAASFCRLAGKALSGTFRPVEVILKVRKHSKVVIDPYLAPSNESRS